MSTEHTDDDLAALRHLLPAPSTVALPPQRQRHLEDRVFAAVAASEAARTAALRRRRRIRAGGPRVLVAACLLAVAVLGASVLFGGGGAGTADPVTRPVVAAPAAVTVLGDAARAALRSSTSSVGGPVGPGDHVYVRSVQISNEGALGGPVELGEPHEREVWYSQETGPTAAVGVIREFGQDWPIEAADPLPPGLARPTYAWLESLPEDPDALLALLEQAPSWQQQDGDLDRDQRTFTHIGDLVLEGLVPPRVLAGLFEAVTRIPGVEVDPGAEDALGRRGIGIGRRDAVTGMETVWVLDPTTYEVLGSSYSGPVPSGTPDATGRVLYGAGAILDRGVVPEVGERP